MGLSRCDPSVAVVGCVLALIMPGAAILQFTGFFLGIVLHAFLLWVVLRRRSRGSFERLLLVLLGALLVWFAGNFLGALLLQMDLDRVGLLLQWVDVVSFSALAVLPATLLHTHWSYLRRRYPSVEPAIPWVFPLVILLYAALVGLPAALPYLLSDPSTSPIERLGPFRQPFLVVLTVSYLGSLLLQVKVLRLSGDAIEKRLFSRLIPLFILIPLFNLWVFELRSDPSTGLNYLTSLALMASLFPSCLVAYYIYRHQFLQIQVHRSLASALLVLAVIAAYLWGIRSLVDLLERTWDAPGLILEAAFLAGLLLLFPTVSGWLHAWVSRTFTEELLHFRQLAEQLQELSLTTVSAATFRTAAEDLLSRRLPAEFVRILAPCDPPQPDLLPLRSGHRLVGCLELRSGGTDSPGRREGIRLICAELAASLERCALLERHLALQQELSRRSRLEELGRMAATVAHNVNNPLSSMKTLLQLRAESPQIPNEQKRETRMIVDEVDRLARTVTNLLRFSRNSAFGPSEAEAVHLKTFIEGILLLLRGRLAEKGLEVEWDERTVDAEVICDRTALAEVFSNLLINAIEASPAGGRIVAGVTPGLQGFEVTFVDQGPGIPEAMKEKVLEPFVTTKASGTGLGLAICRRRLEELGGRLQLEAASEGRGTRATVHLSARQT
jgi:signal transduction histidine kinase